MREFCLGLARAGIRMPIGTDLVLHEHPDPDAILHDGIRLGKVIEEAARRYRTPLAVPLMDLRLEKTDLLAGFGVPESQVDTFHFDSAPSAQPPVDARFPVRNQAHIDSIRYIAECTDLVPAGMAIGPFSLMTKLMADPITAVAMAGAGLSGEDDSGVHLATRCLSLAEASVHRSVLAQIKAGARAVLICEPAANVVYLSPKQIKRGSDIFERFVMQPNLRLKHAIENAGASLIFHDCGELNTWMVRQFGRRIYPVILSLGSSRKLWEDAAVVPKDVVLFGNLPTKNFYSDAVTPPEQVEALTTELIARMRDARHPHILGSECDVLHVSEAAGVIRNKVRLMLECQPHAVPTAGR